MFKKKGDKGIVLSWKRRFLQLIDSKLTYYEKEGGLEKGYVLIDRNMKVIKSIEIPDNTFQECAFQLMNKDGNGRIWEFCAETPQERADWMKILLERIQFEQSHSYQIRVTIKEARNLRADENADPYLVVMLHNTQFKTQVAKKTLNPQWNETFVFTEGNEDTQLQFEIFDHSMIGSDKKIDRTTFSIENLVLNVEHIQHLTLAVQGDLIISIISIKNNVPPPAPIRFPQITEWKIVEKTVFSFSRNVNHGSKKSTFL